MTTQAKRQKSIEIIVYGTKTLGQSHIVREIQFYLDKADLAYDLKEETDIDVFIEKKIESVPAIQFDDGEILALRNDGNFNRSLKQCVSDILESRSYGSLPSILIATDFSDTSVNALFYGYRLASHMHFMTSILHVYNAPLIQSDPEDFYNCDLGCEHKTQLNKFIDHLSLKWENDLSNVSIVKSEFRVGSPSQEILAASESPNIEYIVMGTTGEAQRIRKYFGSIAASLINNSSKSLLLVPPEAKYNGIKNIMMICESKTFEASMIQNLMDFSNAINSCVHFLFYGDLASYGEEHKLISAMQSDRKCLVKSITSAETDKLVQLENYLVEFDIDMIAYGVHQKAIFNQVFSPQMLKSESLLTKKVTMIVKS